MSLDDGNTDDYIVTALQIFQYCGADAGSTLRVDILMEQFAPFVKTNKKEYSYLKSLLDPEQSNPEITVSMLATGLTKYSENQKVKVDLDESFNLKNEQMPHDSDSGISTDGFQLLEELQCELREKSHLAQQLRTQLDYSDRHHEEALATVTAERDSLRTHLNMIRDENMALTHVRRDYEDVCERLSCSEKTLEESRKELECSRRRLKVLTEQVTMLENEKLNLQDLLSQSKDECHRINDMYASRQSSLLEDNENLRADNAEMSTRMRYQEDIMKQINKEKIILEMEVKDMLNKSNQIHQHLSRSIDVSYTEDQMLSALESLNADSRFPQDSGLLDEQAFINALKEDQGRPTNVSLFDELRLSFCNISRDNTPDLNFTQPIEKPVFDDFTTSCTQTDDKLYYVNKKDIFKDCSCKIVPNLNTINVDTQRNDNITRGADMLEAESNMNNIQDNNNLILDVPINQNNIEDKAILASEMKENIENRKDNIIIFDSKNIKYRDKANLISDQKANEDMVNEKEKRYVYIKNRKHIKPISASNVGVLKRGPYRMRLMDDYSKRETKDQATNTSTNVFDVFKDIEVMNFGTQTEAIEIEHTTNNNNVQVCFDCTKCVECHRLKKYVTKLENDVSISNSTICEIEEKFDQYQELLEDLSRCSKKEAKNNHLMKLIVDDQKAKLSMLVGDVCVKQMSCETCSLETQTESEESSEVSTQVDTPCFECVQRKSPHRSIRRFLWEPLKSLFQLFAVLCFMLALYLLYGVTRRWRACRDPLPWSWLQISDLLDLFLTIEYVSDVPM